MNQSMQPRASQMMRSAAVMAAMVYVACFTSGCVQNPVAPAQSISDSHGPAVGHQGPATGSRLRIAAGDQPVERMKWTDVNDPVEQIRFNEGSGYVERMQFSENRSVER